ncbi:MAG: hypothetical protein DCC75_06420 [Proteobacteria bacterium]|nr:MAG: hypothetical protein DCC75_06420 [Pseudomonadota bacterium]
MVGTYVWQIVEGLVKILFATVAIFALDFWVALNVLAMGLVTILMMVTFNTKVRDSIRHNNKFYDKINRICVDYLFNIVTVKTLKLEPGAKEYLGSHQNDGRSIARSIAFWTELKWGSVGFGYALVMGTSLLIYFWGHRGFEGAFDVAQVYVLMNYLDRIFQAIGSFTGYYGGIIESATAYEDADRIHRELAEEARLPAPRSVKPNWRVFSIRDLQFSYIPGERSGLRNISIDIGRADKIALVGPSGGGKSTLLKILAGMVPPEKVTIGTDQESGLSIDDVANYALLLPQEPEIFSQSLRQNLLMGDNFSQSELEYFAKFCRVEGVIEKLPGGWECDLAEKGLNMSVGEKQRVALARGLLRAKDKQILLLDEPTSSLDPLTEKAIFQDLLRQFADRAIVTACHRLALVPLFDKIVLIRNGRIEETGSFDQLLAQNGQFAAAWADYQTRVLKDEEIEDSGMMDMR